jgi:hypothetical protein
LQSTVSRCGELFYAGGQIFHSYSGLFTRVAHCFIHATLNSRARTSVHTSDRMLSPSQRYVSRRRAMFTPRDAMFAA